MSNFNSDMEKFAYAVGINMGEYVEQTVASYKRALMN